MKNIQIAHTAASSSDGHEWNSWYCIQWKQETEDKEENQSLKYKKLLHHHRHDRIFFIISMNEIMSEELHSYLSYIHHSLSWVNRDQQRWHLHRKHVIPLPSAAFILCCAHCRSSDTYLSCRSFISLYLW